jgi:hypothetical protein
VIAAALLLGAAAIRVLGPRLDEVDASREDIFHVWNAGRLIADGANPYARIVGNDMRINHKYATYLPGFYLLAAATHAAWRRDFADWLLAWRRVLWVLHLAIGLVIAWLVAERTRPSFGLFAFVFWLLNRWSLYLLSVAHIDAAAILPLLLSLACFPRRRRASLLLLGVSLAIKQLAGILIPLYLIWTWRAAPKRRAPIETLKAAVFISAIPILVSIPFLLWNAEGFLRSILFSLTRLPGGGDGALSIDAMLEVEGLPARLAMIAMLLAVYRLASLRTLGVYSSALLVQLVFLGFNPVLFPQYVACLAALTPPAVTEWLLNPRRASAVAA